MFKNTKTQGDWGLGVAIAYFTKNSYTVMIPLTDSQDYDLVVDKDKLQKVQIKSTTYKTKYNNYAVSLTIKGGNQTSSSIKKFDKTKVDILFIVTPNGEYLIPTKELENTSSITLGKIFDKYKV